ncbi:gluconate 2-dehydrogenase subunit 3 family protein [Paenibacillus sp. SYP-B3998]|uniref:Gluconate 2-dehydrogenase subunit 3 family protein n=1 Tax=Paenibacillus sp. SYP-B3998 TaxID=2678564 RepID=A0A6G4A4W8_9BACL|nr:gluconate 2-dehydrogenase subunit 3 family protein [Paenibacillus sp. SYP-B3998]NEW09556.1 gluconate 2-dehydrogenase subunit 3 family protein [Paenibacillus sp. SYP-B3998]
MEKHTHYPTYDVMTEQNAWDTHTRSLVQARTIREHPYRFFNSVETECLRAYCSLLMDDRRGEIIQYILSHIDLSVSGNKGEGQRKIGVPPAKVLLRNGLKAIDESGWMANSQPFSQLDESLQRQIMLQISEGTLAHTEAWEGIPQKELFQKLLTLTVEAYYSHPQIWSEIGFGGPAYPRGYLTSRMGQHDPWEAVSQP